MNKEWWLVEAGEYVLGTLRGPERELFEKLLKSDRDAQNLVMYWERRFGELESTMAARMETPTIPESVWTNIETRINNEALDTTIASIHDTETDRRVETITKPFSKSLDRQLRWWQTVGALSLAASFALMAVLLAQWGNLVPNISDNVASTAKESSAYTIVSVLSDEGGAQLWAIVADEQSGQVRAIALDPPTEQPTQSHQLWVVLPNNEGVESIGLLPYATGEIQTFNMNTEDALLKLKSGEAFAISVEPAGGTSSPTPTGPVISSQVYTRITEPL